MKNSFYIILEEGSFIKSLEESFLYDLFAFYNMVLSCRAGPFNTFLETFFHEIAYSIRLS